MRFSHPHRGQGPFHQRHGHGHGGHHGGPFGGHGAHGGGRGGKGLAGFKGGHMTGGRKLSGADLQLVVLTQLEQQAAHGYELIRALDHLSNGFYVPSPGVIYPALNALEEHGWAMATPEGARKRYSLTPEGLAQLNQHRESADAILAALRDIGSRMADVREAFGATGPDSPWATDPLHQARFVLKSAVQAKKGASATERQRIADILQRAAAEILSGEVNTSIPPTTNPDQP